MKLSRSVLALSLAATLLAAALAPEAADDLVAPAQRSSGAAEHASDSSNAKPVAPKTASIDVLAIRPRAADGESPSVLSALSRRPQVSPAGPAIVHSEVVAAPPQAPALPFRVLGRYVEAGEETVFLQHGERNTVARVGDIVDDIYKIESVSAGVLTLVYLPLNQRQTLNIGETP